ncbi:alpha-glucosidase [Candidatus Enterococcus leclercqii]|uniref:alpha-glucosidase n=1 Tax=Candidatus Enterococcus leclercqii TaxID=1857218 RepID=UPI00137B3F46|nr:alpha-glucosidase [Enterococcus sp. CU9D]KAF1292672.1 glucohydrolase [Enterococcus sp. CU9D]
MTSKMKWWHSAIGYQIYPKSFQDTNHDGIGDIAGITQRLDHLTDLGVDVVWISPVNLSPMMDHGYDISDYYQIDPSFGSNEDFSELLAKAGEKGIKILMDLVINHTSTEHPWFKAAMADLDSEYADYYVIKEGRENGAPPNNWRSMFGGSAWEKISGTDNKFYLHLFTVGQPDLNWENPKLRQKLYEMIRYWLDQGVAGFRIDAIAHIKKIYDEKIISPDGPDGLATVWEQYRNACGIGEFLKEMREAIFADSDVLTIAEMDVPDPDQWLEYFGDNGYFSSIFDFYHTPYTIQEEKYQQDPAAFVDLLKQKLYKKQVLANDRVFFTNFLENHDLSRMPDRLIPQKDISFDSITAWSMMYFFLRGIPVIYQGQEIGMRDYPKTSIDGYLDLATHNSYRDYLLRGLTPAAALAKINQECRENSRTPMQWDAGNFAGFSEVSPWFAVNPNYPQVNVAWQAAEPDSLLNFFKKMTSLRKSEKLAPLMIYGRTVPVLQEVKGLVAYYREREGQRLVVVANLTANMQKIPLKKAVNEPLLNNLPGFIQTTAYGELQPYQSVIWYETGGESLAT